MKLKILLATVVLGGALSSNLAAAPLSGTFDITGYVTVTLSDIMWFLNQGGASQQASVVGASGDFATVGTGGNLVGDTITIHNLNNAIEPVGVIFAAQTFVEFPTAPTLPDLLINQIPLGVFGSANCFTGPAAIGQTCTLPNSPFSFINTDGGGGVITSTASFTFRGITEDGLSTWTGTFTSNFNDPFQTVLQAFAPGGSNTVSNSYSGTFRITVSPIVPEPGTMALMGFGLVAVSAVLRRRGRMNR